MLGEANFTFCFHDKEEVGPAALAKIAKETGLRPEDLSIDPAALGRSNSLEAA